MEIKKPKQLRGVVSERRAADCQMCVTKRSSGDKPLSISRSAACHLLRRR